MYLLILLYLTRGGLGEVLYVEQEGLIKRHGLHPARRADDATRESNKSTPPREDRYS